MTDVHTPEQRRYNMSQVKGKDTNPELMLRKELFGRGLRGYRLKTKLPGKPDIVFSRKKVVIFVDGCFWHKCPKCFKLPKSNVKFWRKKINGNVKRDNEVNARLNEQGYKVLRFWTHELKEDFEDCIMKIFISLK